MPQTKAAKKALRSSLRKRAQNLVWKRRIKDLKRKIKKALESKDKEIFALISQYFQVLDKSVKRNILAKNTAARYKSRLMKKVIAQFGKDFQLPRIKPGEASLKKSSKSPASKKSQKTTGKK